MTASLYCRPLTHHVRFGPDPRTLHDEVDFGEGSHCIAIGWFGNRSPAKTRMGADEFGEVGMS